MSDFDLPENATAFGAESLLIVHAQNRSERLIVPALCDLGFSLANQPRQLVCLDSGSGDDHRNLVNITGSEVGKKTIPEAGPGFPDRSAQDDAKLDCLARSLVEHDLIVEATVGVGLELMTRLATSHELQAMLLRGHHAPRLIVTLSVADANFRDLESVFEKFGALQEEFDFRMDCVILDKAPYKNYAFDRGIIEEYFILWVRHFFDVDVEMVPHCFSELFKKVENGRLSLPEACLSDARRFANSFGYFSRLGADTGFGHVQTEQNKILEWVSDTLSTFRRSGLIPHPPVDAGEAA